jgi:hypothetical protein
VELHILFLDLKLAYDSVGRSQLFRIFIMLGMPVKLVHLIKMTMGNSKGRVEIQEILLESFTIQNGLRQGDPLSTILFNLASEYMTRRITSNPGGNIYNRLYQHLAYADDLCMIARRHSSLSQPLRNLRELQVK